MKSTRYAILASLATIITFFAVTFSSCSKDDCEDIICQNGGVCVDGSCACPTGYEGLYCEKHTNAVVDFEGTYTASSSCDTTTYQFTIVADTTTAGRVFVTNLGKYNCLLFPVTFEGTVTGNTLHIMDTVCNNRMNATGTLSNGTLVIDYMSTHPVLLGSVTDTCSAIAVK